jgi:hypothetical protein
MTKKYNTSSGIYFLIIILLLAYIIFLSYRTPPIEQKIKIQQSISNDKDRYNDPYSPPLRNDTIFLQQRRDYSQMGILTREEQDKHPIILPLMGRHNNRDKLQYYTISNTGSNNTKLPIKVKGKSCTSERGCDELYSNDEVYVEGYQNSFKVTIYENNTFNYNTF